MYGFAPATHNRFHLAQVLIMSPQPLTHKNRRGFFFTHNLLTLFAAFHACAPCKWDSRQYAKVMIPGCYKHKNHDSSELATDKHP